MNLIDTHSHLYSSEFKEDITQVIKNSILARVNKILLPNMSSKYTANMLNLCNKFPKNCFPMMGLHPCYVQSETYMKELKHVEDEIKKGGYIAVGEIGLDLYWDTSTLEIQKKSFIYQIQIAKKFNLPIVIHVRDSFEEAIRIVENENDEKLRGVFHCFTGDIKDAERIIKLGNFYLGVGGVLTFKNSGIDKTIAKINSRHLVLETDSPYLSPAPNRGKRNESKYLVNIANKLAKIHNTSIEDIAAITTDNARKLFRI